MASPMLAEVEIWDFVFDRCCSAVPFHLVRAGVVYAILNFSRHFSCLLEAENPDRIKNVG